MKFHMSCICISLPVPCHLYIVASNRPIWVKKITVILNLRINANMRLGTRYNYNTDTEKNIINGLSAITGLATRRASARIRVRTLGAPTLCRRWCVLTSLALKRGRCIYLVGVCFVRTLRTGAFAFFARTACCYIGLADAIRRLVDEWM